MLCFPIPPPPLPLSVVPETTGTTTRSRGLRAAQSIALPKEGGKSASGMGGIIDDANDEDGDDGTDDVPPTRGGRGGGITGATEAASRKRANKCVGNAPVMSVDATNNKI